MNLAIELQSEELSVDLIEKIKGLFNNRLIQIIVSDKLETTDYLLNNPINRQHLISSLNETQTIDFTPDSFIEYSKNR